MGITTKTLKLARLPSRLPRAGARNTVAPLEIRRTAATPAATTKQQPQKQLVKEKVYKSAAEATRRAVVEVEVELLVTEVEVTVATTGNREQETEQETENREQEEK